MKHYAGLDLSMETTQVCIVDEKSGKVASIKVETAPDMIAYAVREAGGVERAVIETGRMSPGSQRSRRVHRCIADTSESEGIEGVQDRPS